MTRFPHPCDRLILNCSPICGEMYLAEEPAGAVRDFFGKPLRQFVAAFQHRRVDHQSGAVASNDDVVAGDVSLPVGDGGDAQKLALKVP